MSSRLSPRLKIALALFLVGWLLLLTGFAYDVIFAGVPYQDPTPEMTAEYNRQRQTAERIELIGLVAAGVGTVVICLALGVTALRRRAGSATGA